MNSATRRSPHQPFCVDRKSIRIHTERDRRLTSSSTSSLSVIPAIPSQTFPTRTTCSSPDSGTPPVLRGSEGLTASSGETETSEIGGVFDEL